MGLEMGALGSISADVRHKAAPPGPRRSPPALGVPWGHAPPVWCHTGAHNTPDWTHDSAPGWRRSWRLGVCGSGPGAFQVDVGQLRARVRVPGSCGVRGAALGPLYGNAFAVASEMPAWAWPGSYMPENNSTELKVLASWGSLSLFQREV